MYNIGFLSAIHCCDISEDAYCQTVCKERLRSDDTSEAKIAAIQDACGKVGFMV